MSPYEILGISSTATDDEVKKAYRTLSKKYHPDANVGSPHQAEYTEMFKKVQNAYDDIMAERRGEFRRNSYSTGDGQDYSSYANYGNDNASFRSAAQYINAQRFQEAKNILSGIQTRNDLWFYYSAICENGLGNSIQAREYAQVALQMNPYNMQYQIFYQQLTRGQRAYSTMSQSYGRTISPVQCCYSYFIIQCILGCLFSGGRMGFMPYFCCF